MKRMILNVATLMVLLSAVDLANAQTLGVYFDQGGTQPYVSGSTLTYPCALDAYVVVKGFDPADGLLGWECRLAYTDSLFVSVTELYGQALNVTPFPNFMVGLVTPIGLGGDVALVAKLSITAIGPGDIYLNASQPCSIPLSQLPVVLSGESLWPATTEYGGQGSPCATVGRAARPTLNASGIALVSQYTAMEFRDDGLYAQSSTNKSWVRLPTFSGNGPIALTPEQRAMTMLIPSAQVADKAAGKRADILFSSGFEDYVPNYFDPFVRSSGEPEFYAESAGVPDVNSRKYLWGVTNTLAAPGGTRSAYCAANYEVCNWTTQPASNCATYSSSNRAYQNDMDSEMIMSGYHLTGESNTRLEFKLWSDVEQGYDELRISLVTVEQTSPYRIETTPFATIPYNAQWSVVSLDLPTNIPNWGVTTFVFEFFSDNMNGDGSHVGVYLDDIAIKKYDTNLFIESVNPPSQPCDNLSTPIPVTVTIRNSGSTDSGEFSLAYSRGTFRNPDALEGFVTVPSIGPGGTATVSVDVPYSTSGAKSFDQRVANLVNFLVDAQDQVPETSEVDNWSFPVTLLWSIPNAPVILVHGIMGGALEKSGEQVWSEDLGASIRNLLWSPQELARRDDTNDEVDNRYPMSVPSAYGASRGFFRDPAWTLTATLNSGVIGPNIAYPIPVDVNDQRGLWRPLLNNLTTGSDGQYSLPATDPGDPTANQDIYLFNYDWRVDLNPGRSATLAGSAYARLDDLITKIRAAHPGADRLTVVSHSMGGLVVESYIRRKTNLGVDPGIRRWIAIGTPFEGSESSMATLFGANGFHFPVAGAIVGQKVANLTKNYVSMWELLPTPHADAEPQNASYWRGPGVFSDVTGTHEFTYVERTLPRMLYANKTMAMIESNDPHIGGWSHSLAARDYAQTFQNQYMRNTLPQIANVDTWVIAGTSVSTLRGVERYDLRYPTLDPFVPSASDYRKVAHDLAYGSGDGTVSVWSATSANVAPQNLHTRYRQNVEHSNLLRDSAIGNFVGDVIRGRSLSNYSGLLPDFDPSSGDRTWYLRWHTDAAVWVGSAAADKSTPIVGTPVALDLFDVTNNKLLVGLAYSAPAQPGAGAVSFTAVNDPRFSYFEIGDDIYITSTTTDPLNLRLIIRPSPLLRDPAVPPVKAPDTLSGAKVLGHVHLVDGNSFRMFPGYADNHEFVSFYDLGTAGFGAYADFSIHDGYIQGSQLVMNVDSDGDGHDDMQVAAVANDADNLPPDARTVGLKCAPNPFNASTDLQWDLGDQEAHEMRIFDMSGRAVRVMQLTSARVGSVSFDGRDDDGRSLPSGTYLASIVDATGTPRATQKMVLAK